MRAFSCSTLNSHTHRNTHRNTHMRITSDPYLGVCPGEIWQVGRVNAQTGDLKSFSLQSYWLLLVDSHRGRRACRETDVQMGRHRSRDQVSRQESIADKQVHTSYHERPRGLTVSIQTACHPSSLSRRSVQWKSTAGPGSVLLSLGQKSRSYHLANPGLGRPLVGGWGWKR